MKDNLPKRKNIRLKSYDYSLEGYYFITICTKNRECILSKIKCGSVKTDPYIELNDIGKFVEKKLKEIEKHFETIKIHDYVIMPNHLHFVLEQTNVGAGLDQPANKITIGNVVGLFKSGISRKIGYAIWQRNYYEHVIRNEKEYLMIKQYIINNPYNWEEDKYY